MTVTVIGADAGAGDDPASNTILDAQGQGRVLVVGNINTSPTIDLQRLRGVRITGGRALGAAGVLNYGALSMTGSTLAGNEAQGSAAGGLDNAVDGAATLTDCAITGNSAAAGGGLYQRSDQPLVLHGCVVWGNTATRDAGGDIAVRSGTLTLDAATRITGNTATTAVSGGGISNNGGAVNLNGATISGNTPDNCSGVSGC